MPRCADRVTWRGRSQRDGQFTNVYARDTLVDTMLPFAAGEDQTSGSRLSVLWARRLASLIRSVATAAPYDVRRDKPNNQPTSLCSVQGNGR